MCIPAAVSPSIVEVPPLTVSRKRVSFEEDPSTQIVKRRILEYGPLSAEFSVEEKQQRWMQMSDKEAITVSANSEAQDCRIADACKQARGQPGSYTEAYTTLFASSRAGFSHEMAAALSPDLIATLALSEARGLEDRIIPQIALERRFHRIRAIRSVVQLQRQEAYGADHIRAAYEAQCKPPREMAESLGMADATAAMIAYTADGDQPCNKTKVVPDSTVSDGPPMKRSRTSMPITAP